MTFPKKTRKCVDHERHAAGRASRGVKAVGLSQALASNSSHVERFIRRTSVVVFQTVCRPIRRLMRFNQRAAKRTLLHFCLASDQRPSRPKGAGLCLSPASRVEHFVSPKFSGAQSNLRWPTLDECVLPPAHIQVTSHRGVQQALSKGSGGGNTAFCT